MWRNTIGLLLLIYICCGCEQFSVEPMTEVITEPSKRDFGFSGQWKEDGKSGEPLLSFEIERMDDETKSRYVIKGEHDEFKTHHATFTVAEISAEKNQVIVEVLVTDNVGRTYRRLAYATIQNDELRITSINKVLLGELLYAGSVPAVIEHSMQSSTVRCNPDGLLKVLRENSEKLPGAARRFQRIENEGK
ncbi:MAG: hypothetical protein JNL58_24980 [Planctomyces sp.]|nr:hypothetical protein [Planctomyces sp.]